MAWKFGSFYHESCRIGMVHKKKKKSYWDVLLWRSNKVKKIIFPCSSIENPIMSRPHIWGLIHITMHTWSLQLQGILFHGGTNSCADMLANRGISPPERDTLWVIDYDTCLTFLWKCLYGNLGFFFSSKLTSNFVLLFLSCISRWTYLGVVLSPVFVFS